MTDKPINSRECYPSHALPVLARPGRPSLLSLILIGLFLLCGCGSGKVKFADQKRSGPIVVLGDSLAAGYQLQEGESFVDLLGKRLKVEMVNLGVSGATTGDSLPRVAEEVIPLKPALVIIELGGNDALQKLDLEVTRKNLQSMVDQLHANQTPVLVLGVRGGVLSDKFADLFEELASENQLAYVPNILEGILTSPTLRVDNVHPNADGHKLIADRVEPTLRKLVQQLGLAN
jgi:acyl-CoA thioesterase I